MGEVIMSPWSMLKIFLCRSLLCVDNQGAIFLASNPAQEGCIKHVQMPEHYICEVIEFGEIQLFYVSTNQQFTNIFMKNLDKTKF